MFKYECTPHYKLKRHVTKSFILCYLIDGKGELIVNGIKNTVKKGSLFLLTPDTIVEGRADELEPPKYYMIFFNCINVESQTKKLKINEVDFNFAPFITSQSSKTKQLFQKLFSMRNEKSDIDKLRIKQLFYELIILFISANSTIKEEESGIDYAIKFLDEHFYKEIKMDDLAKSINFSSSYFTRQFKKYVGMTPMDYLTKRRITSAKKLLACNNLRLKEVAEQVGYNDELYFSRMFKKLVGTSPTVYVKKQRKRIAAIGAGLDEYLIALGIDPVVRTSYNSMVVKNDSIPFLKERKTDIFIEYEKPCYETIFKVNPDLIITSEQKWFNNDHIAPLKEIAFPIYTKKTLWELAIFFHKEDEAKEWLKRYEHKTLCTKEKLAKKIKQETVCFLRIDSKYRLYSKQQIGQLFYHELGMQLPSNISTIDFKVDLDLEELFNYEPDHLFIMVNPGEHSKKNWYALQNSKEWLQWKPVKKGNIYDGSDYIFKALGFFGKMYLMDHISKQICRE